MNPGWWIAVVIALMALAGLGAFGWGLQRRKVCSLEKARESFRRRREWLEADFVARAAASGKPRGLRWLDCDFDDEVAFARDRRTGCFRALVGVTIRFEAIQGGEMEDVVAVGNLKAATVVFRLDGNEWEADGRAIFNLTPSQTIERYHKELETVD